MSRALRKEDELINAWLQKSVYCMKHLSGVALQQKDLYHSDGVKNTQLLFPPHHHLLLVLATGLFGLQSASEAWKTAEIVLLQTSLVTQSGDGGFTYENKIIIFMLFLKKEIKIRISTLIIGNIHIYIHIHIIIVVVVTVIVVLNATAENKDALTQTGRSNRSLLEAKRAFQDFGSC